MPTAGALAERFGLALRGDADVVVEGVATLASAGPAQLSFLANPRYRAQLAGSGAGVVVLREADATPFLVRHDAVDWHLHATAPDATLGTVVVVETAMGAVDVVRSDEWERMKTCEGEGCTAVLVDLSRNRSRRFCDVNSCGNRAHVAAYRARRAGTEERPPLR